MYYNYSCDGDSVMENVHAISSYKDHCNFFSTSGPYFWANFEYHWSLSGPYYSCSFFVNISDNWEKMENSFRSPVSMDMKNQV